MSTLTISNNSLTVNPFNGGKPGQKMSNAQKKALEKGQKGEYNGEMSDKARRKVHQNLESWMLSILLRKKSIKGYTQRPTFVTLTLPSKQQHDDNTIKRRGLNRFLIYMQKYEDVEEYFWRAELQKNGNIHFHLFIDRYVPRTNIFNIWFGCMEDLGYIEPYELKFKNRNPPCVDVRGIKNAFSVTGYLLKYVQKSSTKKDEKTQNTTSQAQQIAQEAPNNTHQISTHDFTTRKVVEGRIYGMSDSIKKYTPVKVSHINFQGNTMLSEAQKEQVYLYQDIAENPNLKHYSNEKGIEKHYYKPLKKGDASSLTEYIQQHYPTLYSEIKAHYVAAYNIAHTPKTVTETTSKKNENKNKSIAQILEEIPTFAVPYRCLGSSPTRRDVQMYLFETE